MIAIARLMILAVCVSLAGCMQLTHKTRGEASGPYSCTTEVAIMFGDAAFGPWNRSFAAYKQHIDRQFMFPFLLIDLPCEAVVETITFPFDYYYKKKEK